MPATDPDAPLTRATQALWGLSDTGRRGPKPAMSVQSIAAEGVALADAEGLAAVTMGAVAKRLGFTTMSLYRYVESREDLLGAMMDAAVGPPPGLNRRLGWRRQVEAWARAWAVQLVAHPWILDVRLAAPPVTPNLLGWTDAGFACLSRSGLPTAQVAAAVLTVDGYVRSSVSFHQQYAGNPEADLWAARLRQVVDPEELPALAAVLESGTLEDDPGEAFPGAEFDFGLGLILDGIEAAQ